MKRTCQLIKNINDDNFDCTKSTSVSELYIYCDADVLTHPVTVANNSLMSILTIVGPNFAEKNSRI